MGQDVSPDVRLIILDDHALSVLGREPRLDEWRKLAEALAGIGFERVILHQPATRGGTSASTPNTGVMFAAGVVDFPAATDAVGIDAENVPRDHLLAPDEAVGERLPVTHRLIGANAAAMPLVTAFGAMNMASDNSMPAGYVTTDGGAIVPNLALLAMSGLAWRDGAFTGKSGPIAIGVDGLLRIDFVPSAAVVKVATRLSSVIAVASDGSFQPKTGDKTLARLAGGKVAVLVPEGYTGSRYLESPLEGKVPVYVGFVSLISNVLTGHPLHVPVAGWVIALAATLLLALCCARATFRQLTYATCAIAFATLVIASLTLHAFGWILPAIPVVALASVALASGAAQQWVVTSNAKATFERDLALGNSVQSLCLPKVRSGVWCGWDFKVHHEPLGPMFGDWLQIHLPERGEGMALIAIGDVVGKGPSAALITAVIATVWRTHTARGIRRIPEDVHALLQEIDRSVRSSFDGDQYTTISLAALDEHGATIFRHAAPKWLAGTAGAWRSLGLRSTGALGQGTLAGPVKGESVAVQPGDAFIAYTDGMIDNMREAERYLERLQGQSLDGALERAFATAYTAAEQVGAATALPDDKTFLVIRRV